MSLSFVKSAVLSSTDGVSHNEETTIDNQETKSLRAAGGGTHKPLFEQLRANQEAAQEKDEEFQRSLRGMRPLDEEDCAHLDAVERAKGERERAAKSGIESEVALFRAAREDRGLVQTVVEEEEGGGEDAARGEAAIGGEAMGSSGIPAKKEATKIVPKFTIKKKRKRTPQEGEKASETNKKGSGVNQEEEDGKEEKKALPKTTGANDDSDSDNEGGGLLGLACYGSDSD